MVEIHRKGIYVPVRAICGHHDHVICSVLEVWMSDFSQVLLSAVFLDLYGVVDSKPIRRIYKPRSRDGTNNEENQQHSQWSQCCELRRGYNSSEIHWYWGYLQQKVLNTCY